MKLENFFKLLNESLTKEDSLLVLNDLLQSYNVPFQLLSDVSSRGRRFDNGKFRIGDSIWNYKDGIPFNEYDKPYLISPGVINFSQARFPIMQLIYNEEIISFKMNDAAWFWAFDVKKHLFFKRDSWNYNYNEEGEEGRIKLELGQINKFKKWYNAYAVYWVELDGILSQEEINKRINLFT